MYKQKEQMLVKCLYSSISDPKLAQTENVSFSLYCFHDAQEQQKNKTK